MKDPAFSFGGRSVIDPQLANFYGNSLGGIMGEVYMACSTDVVNGNGIIASLLTLNIACFTGVLGVTGGPFGLLLPRSEDFLP